MTPQIPAPAANVNLQPKTLKTEVRVLVYGQPANGYIERSPPVQDAFPGAEVPDFCYLCRSGIDGQQILLPPTPDPLIATPDEEQAFLTTFEESVRPLFEQAIGSRGPVGACWTLLSDPLPTQGGGPIWRRGYAMLAFEVGVQPLDVRMKPDLTKPPGAFRVNHGNGVVVKYWVAFHAS